MTAVIPARFLFRWSWPVPRSDTIPAPTGQLLALPEAFRRASLGEFDGVTGFAESRLAWNHRGIGFSFQVRGKTKPIRCQPMNPADSDGVTLWLDTRATQNVHRVTRFCRQFTCLPTGSGRKKDQPSITTASPGRFDAGRSPVAAKEDAAIRCWSEIRDDGYLLEVWFPAESLTGFDPGNHRQLGFYYLVHDRELGDQPLTVDRDFPFEHDPSLWQILDLRD